MAQAFQMDGDFVKGVWSGGGSEVPDGTLSCSPEQVTEYKSETSLFPGTDDYRWTYIGGALAEATDARKVGTWSPDASGSVNGNGDVEYDLEVGSAEPEVTLTITPGTITATQILEFAAVGPVKAVSVNGVVSLFIKTDVKRRTRIDWSDLLQLSNELRIRVSEVKI